MSAAVALTAPYLPDVTDSDVVKAAEVYAAAGLRIVALWGLTPSGACQCRSADCGKQSGKHPVMKGWPARSAAETLEHLRRHPGRNLGLVMGGPLRLIALDVDGEAGAVQLVTFEDRHGRLPPTATQRTGSGGEHRLFFCPDHLDITRLGNRTRVAGSAGEAGAHAGLDVRADRGFIVVAPSTHRSGNPYQWTATGDLAPLPDALFDLLASPLPEAPTPPPAPSVVTGSSAFGPDASRPDAISRARRYVSRLAPAVEGSGGHATLLGAAWYLTHGFALSDAEAESVLWSDFNPRCSPPWPAGHQDIRRKVRESRRLDRCLSHPRGYLLEAEGERRYQPTSHPAPTGPSSPADAHEEGLLGSVENSTAVVSWLQQRKIKPASVDLHNLARAVGNVLVMGVVDARGSEVGTVDFNVTTGEKGGWASGGLLACSMAAAVLSGTQPRVDHPIRFGLFSSVEDYLQEASQVTSERDPAMLCLVDGWPAGLANAFPHGCTVNATNLTPDHLDAALDDLLDLAAAEHLTLVLPETP